MSTRHQAFFSKLKKKQESRRADDLHSKADIIASIRFKKQQMLSDDPVRFKAVSCGRRAGKSTGVLTIALERCMRKADSSWVICGLTRPSIKQIYWRTVKKLNDDLDLGLEFNETELTATFSNRSQLRFAGAENASEIEKLRGNAFHGVVIDECKSFNLFVFAELVEDVIRPALADHKGELIIIGTPGRSLGGTFYNATHWPSPINDLNKKPWNIRFGAPGWNESVTWSSHHWDASDNEAAPHIWEDHCLTKANNGWKDSTPVWCREYLGLWVVDSSDRVFRYNPEHNSFSTKADGRFGLPDGHEWFTVLGIDPGYDDPFAFVVWAYSDTHPNLYELYSFSQKGMNVTAAAKFIKELQLEYGPFTAMVGDRAGLGKMMFAELSEQHDLHIERAEKKEKDDVIELFNTDLDNGLVLIEPFSQLAVEMTEHKWVYRGGRRVESDKTKNDTTDAAIYAFRWCDHRRFKEAVEGPEQFTEEWYANLERTEIEAAIKRETEILSNSRLDKDWW